MNDTDVVLHATERAVQAGDDFALATIVATRGSTYRHAGARLVVAADGTWTGNLSGGCLEGEVIEVAQRVMETGQPELVAYDLTADEEAIWGWGLGCNGAIEVLVEPADTGRRAVELYRAGRASGRPFTILTALSAGSGTSVASHALVTDQGQVAGDLGLVEQVGALDRDVGPRVEEQAGLRVFVEEVRPPLRLLVCGAGHDAVPLVANAARLGWRPTVVDDRSSFLTDGRFPEADLFVHTRPEQAAEATQPDELTYVVVMSHNFLRDAEYLRSFLGSGLAYLGMLGPRRRLQRLLDHLGDEVTVTDADRTALHGPAGLDLGAEGPEEIAWSICAEILAVSRGRTGRALRTRHAPIHDRRSVE